MSKFEEIFNREPEIYASAPGRTEICGNHLDHQHGCVIAAAVDIEVIAAAAPRADDMVRIKSEGYDPFELSLGDLAPHEDEKGTSKALVRGVAAGLAGCGMQLHGFDAFVTSDIPAGSGVSSSAAFEVLVGNIFAELSGNRRSTDAVQIARIGQFAENEYFGKPSGLMDQMACSLGGILYIDFKDPENPVIERLAADIDGWDLSLCIVNTGGSHADLTDDYGAVRREMSEAADFFGRDVLREVEKDAFFAALQNDDQSGEMRSRLSDRALLRAMHFYSEMDRVEEARTALKTGACDAFLRCIRNSGDSSFKYLQNIYSPAHPEEQGIAMALRLSEEIFKGFGSDEKRCAARVHGGGFAGTIQTFVPNRLAEIYKEKMERIFGQGAVIIMSIMDKGGCSGRFRR